MDTLSPFYSHRSASTSSISSRAGGWRGTVGYHLRRAGISSRFDKERTSHGGFTPALRWPLDVVAGPGCLVGDYYNIHCGEFQSLPFYPLYSFGIGTSQGRYERPTIFPSPMFPPHVPTLRPSERRFKTPPRATIRSSELCVMSESHSSGPLQVRRKSGAF